MVDTGLTHGGDINQDHPGPPSVFMIQATITTVELFFKFNSHCNVHNRLKINLISIGYQKKKILAPSLILHPGLKIDSSPLDSA